MRSFGLTCATGTVTALPLTARSLTAPSLTASPPHRPFVRNEEMADGTHSQDTSDRSQVGSLTGRITHGSDRSRVGSFTGRITHGSDHAPSASRTVCIAHRLHRAPSASLKVGVDRFAGESEASKLGSNRTKLPQRQAPRQLQQRRDPCGHRKKRILNHPNSQHPNSQYPNP